MKTILILVSIALFWGLQVSAQSKGKVFSSIQKLLNNAVGEELSYDAYAENDKIVGQVFTEKDVIVKRTWKSKGKYDWIKHSFKIPWSSSFKYTFCNQYETQNPKLLCVYLSFNEVFEQKGFMSNKENGGGLTLKVKNLMFYFLTRDRAKITKLLDRLSE